MKFGQADSAACDYCGLPLPGANAGAASETPAAVESAEPRYCCLGCKLAAAITQEKGAEGQARWTLTRLGLAVFFSMNVMVFTLVLWTRDVYRQELQVEGTGGDVFYELARYLCLLFAAPVVLLLAGPLLESAWEQVRRRAAVTDLLLVSGVAAAFFYSLVSVLRGEGHVYFEVACMVLVFVTLGRWLEATGKLKTRSVLSSLEKLLPDRVRLVRDAETVEVAAAEVRRGDTLRILPGERIAVDGTVVRNQGAVDEQAVTGESLPVVKQVGDPVRSGSLNLDGDLWVEAAGSAGQSTMQQVIAAVEQAAMRGERHQRLADRVAAWFLPAVMLIALGAFGVHAWRSDWQTALLSSLAVVLIACPCALGLATPMALWAALGRACQAQVLFREGDAMTRLALARTVCFDKTGTLTTGQAEVEAFICDNTFSPEQDVPGRDQAVPARDQVLRVAAALAAGSTHPLSLAITRYARSQAADASGGLEASGIRSEPGRGVAGDIEGLGQACLGSVRWMRERGEAGAPDRDNFPPTTACLQAAQAPEATQAPEITQSPEAAPPQAERSREPNKPQGLVVAREPAGGPQAEPEEQSLVCVAWGGRVRGVFRLTQQMRDEVPGALGELRQLDCRVRILSGDAGRRVDALSRLLQVEGQGDLLPTDKLRAIESARAAGPVVMVGDGINDAPALAAADVGVSLGSGTDISRDSAPVCLLSSDLRRLAWAIRLSRMTVRTIRWNLVWAFSYNTLGIGLAAAGLLNPILAALAMVGSSLLVVTNSLRLSAFPLEDADTQGGPAAAASLPASGLSASGVERQATRLASVPVSRGPLPDGSFPASSAIGGESRS